MPALDATALNTDPDGLEFLRGVLGTDEAASARRGPFPLEAWTPRPPMVAAAPSSLSGMHLLENDAERPLADAAI